jgi:hypothetical protein
VKRGILQEETRSVLEERFRLQLNRFVAFLVEDTLSCIFKKGRGKLLLQYTHATKVVLGDRLYPRLFLRRETGTFS